MHLQLWSLLLQIRLCNTTSQMTQCHVNDCVLQTKSSKDNATKGSYHSPDSNKFCVFWTSMINNKIHKHMFVFVQLYVFLAATKQLYEWFSPSVCLSVRPSVCLSVRPSVCLSHLFDYVPIILSSWNFQELLPVTKVTSMQKVKVRGQRSRSQRSQPNLTVSGL